MVTQHIYVPVKRVPRSASTKKSTALCAIYQLMQYCNYSHHEAIVSVDVLTF